MEKVKLAIVGCGGMGGRHLLGLKELAQSGMNNVELVAACDLRRDNAERLAHNAEDLLATRPRVFANMADMVRAVPDLQAVAVTTDAGSHHVVACQAFDLGLHVLCEKPLGISMRACNLILAGQARAGKVLSVAENYRRDPMARLTRALLDAGVIGRPYLMFDISASGGSNILILPWRHYKHVGGMVIDGGVHSADLMLYYLGDVDQVYARTGLWEATRYKAAATGVADFYQAWYQEIPEAITATSEDMFVSVVQFKNGATANWTQFYAGHGKGFGQKVIYGQRGSLACGGIRNGVSPVLSLDGRPELTGQVLLELAPDYRLDAIAERLYGAARPASFTYSALSCTLPFPECDRKLLAIEYHEFARCVLTGEMPEVTGQIGRRALGICYAGLESGVLDRPVTVDEVEAERTAVYQADINAYWRL
jgi:predicted dehydrogenase